MSARPAVSAEENALREAFGALAKSLPRRERVCAACRRDRDELGRRLTLQVHHVIKRQVFAKTYPHGALAVEPALVAHFGRPWREAPRNFDGEVLERFRIEWDPRNGLLVCAGPMSCHDRHTTAFQRIPRSALRQENEDFAAEFGFGYLLDKEYV